MKKTTLTVLASTVFFLSMSPAFGDIVPILPSAYQANAIAAYKSAEIEENPTAAVVNPIGLTLVNESYKSLVLKEELPDGTQKTLANYSTTIPEDNCQSAWASSDYVAAELDSALHTEGVFAVRICNYALDPTATKIYIEDSDGGSCTLEGLPLTDQYALYGSIHARDYRRCVYSNQTASRVISAAVTGKASFADTTQNQ